MLIIDCTETLLANFHTAIDICRDSCSYYYHKCCYSKKYLLAKSAHKYYAAMMLGVNVFHHCSNSLTFARFVYE